MKQPVNSSLSKHPIVLDHHIFTDKNKWIAAESMHHPTLRLHLTTNQSDYSHVGATCPNITPTHVSVVTDTGAQSCLWSSQDFYRCGFKKSDLLPVKQTLLATNKEKIRIDGAILVCLSGLDKTGITHTAPTMVYVSPDTERFYLSRETLVQLNVISKNLPEVGAAKKISVKQHEESPCRCLTRTLPPERPNSLPLTWCPENNSKMKEWLVTKYAASTFNKCSQQQLPGMTGPLVRIRRTVDLSPLNHHCLKETHHVKPPYQQARSIPPGEIRPLEKLLVAIQDFPTPTKLSNVQSWFGLVNQVSHYNQLTDLMAPFKHHLSSKAKFAWSEDLEKAFTRSRSAIVEAIKGEVEIFYMLCRTCLRPDWS